MDHWDPRAEILELSHRWQVIFLLFLVGSLIGWGIGFILPSPYRAETEFYVGFNADAFARNPDDYKNWYLSQIELFAVSDRLLKKTLNRLQDQDEYWSTVSTDQLKPKLGTYWRNAGKWRLVAEWTDREHAYQLGQVWSAVFLEQVSQSIADAYTQIELNAQIGTTSRILVETNLRTLRLMQARKALQTWLQELTPPENSTPLKPLERWRLQTLAATLVEFNPVELTLVTQVPSPDSQAQDYVPWVSQLISTSDSQIAALQEQSANLSSQLKQLQDSFQKNVRTSNGLSAYLVVEPFEDTQPAQHVRRNSQMAFVGGLLTELVFALFWLSRPLKKARV